MDVYSTLLAVLFRKQGYKISVVTTNQTSWAKTCGHKIRRPIPVAIRPAAFEAVTDSRRLVFYQQWGLEWRQTPAFRLWVFLTVLFKYMHCYCNALFQTAESLNGVQRWRNAQLFIQRQWRRHFKIGRWVDRGLVEGGGPTADFTLSSTMITK